MSNEIINKHSIGNNQKHSFHAYLHRILNEPFQGIENEEGEKDDDWRSDASSIQLGKSK
jgi:hypothetical protein